MGLLSSNIVNLAIQCPFFRATKALLKFLYVLRQIGLSQNSIMRVISSSESLPFYGRVKNLYKTLNRVLSFNILCITSAGFAQQPVNRRKYNS
jgi:hypothetical protein